MKSFAVLILNYVSWEDTIKEIDELNTFLKINYSDIIVVDNSSPNDSRYNLEKKSKEKGFMLLSSKENGGYASGNNIGLKYAYTKGYKYVWVLNNDILISDKFIIEKIMSVFEKKADIAVVNPDVYLPDGHLLNREAVRPSFWDYTFGLFTYKKKGRKIQDLGGYAYIYRPQGCCMMVDLNKIREIGYFDEHTFLYWEESILAERLMRNNYKCSLCLTTKIVHNHSKTVKDILSRTNMIRINNNSYEYYLRKYRKYDWVRIGICKLFNYIRMLI